MTEISEDLKRGAELLNISVNIGYGQEANLRIFEHDDLSLTVHNFMIQNDITNVPEPVLFRKVSQIMQDLIEEHQAITKIIGKLPNCSSTSFKNPGERMYRESMQSKELKLVNHHMLRVQTARNLKETLKEKPEINQNSIKIASNLTSKASSLYKFQTPTTNSQSELTFTPKLNLKTQRIARKSINSSNRIEELYKDAQVRRSRQASLCNSERESNLKGEGLGRKKEDCEKIGYCFDFPKIPETPLVVDRLINSEKDREKNLDELRKQLQIDIDPVTGQKYFQPQIGKKIERQREDNVWEDLYKHKKRASEGEIDFPYAPVDLEAGQKTQEILDKKKKDKFEEIFKKLRPDSFGRLHSKSITCKELGPDLVRVLDPLLVEIQEAKTFISYKEFCESMENLLKTLNPNEKNLIFAKAKIDPPVIHTKSKSISDFNQLFMRQALRDHKQQQRMDLEKDKVRMEEIKGCTFKPKILKYVPKKSLK